MRKASLPPNRCPEHLRLLVRRSTRYQYRSISGANLAQSRGRHPLVRRPTRSRFSSMRMANLPPNQCLQRPHPLVLRLTRCPFSSMRMMSLLPSRCPQPQHLLVRRLTRCLSGSRHLAPAMAGSPRYQSSQKCAHLRSARHLSPRAVSHLLRPLRSSLRPNHYRPSPVTGNLFMKCSANSLLRLKNLKKRTSDWRRNSPMRRRAGARRRSKSRICGKRVSMVRS